MYLVEAYIDGDVVYVTILLALFDDDDDDDDDDDFKRHKGGDTFLGVCGFPAAIVSAWKMPNAAI